MRLTKISMAIFAPDERLPGSATLPLAEKNVLDGFPYTMKLRQTFPRNFANFSFHSVGLGKAVFL